MIFTDIIMKNLKYNFKRFTSFILVNSFVVAVLFMFGSLLFNQTLRSDPAAGSVRSLIVMAAAGIIIFSIIFLTYTCIYFVKSRGKEFGVYLTVGMTSRDLVRYVFLESFIVFALAALVGTLSGLLFGKLFYLVLGKVLGITTNLYNIGYETFLLSLGVLVVVFIINYFFIRRFINNLSIVEIIKSSRTKGMDEQKPIIGILSAIVFIFSLWLFHATVSGDYDFIKNFVREQPVLAICIPVIGVLASLFLVIGSGMAGVKGIIKRIPAVYNSNILLLSGLSHRFASYRTSLFSVTLLIVLSVFFFGIGLSFYTYGDVTLDYYQPYDFMIEHRGEVNDISESEIAAFVEKYGGEIENISTMTYLDSQIYRELHSRDNLFINVRYTTYLVSESIWNEHMNDIVQLEPDELLVVDNQQTTANQAVDFNTVLTVEPFTQGLNRANTFRETSGDMTEFVGTLDAVQHLQYEKDNTSIIFRTPVNTYGNGDFAKSIVSVIDDSVYAQLANSQQNEVIMFNLKSGDEKAIFNALLTQLCERNNIDEGLWKDTNIKYGDKEDISNLRPLYKAERLEILFRTNGFLLFVLSFLGLLFLMSSCIVLYFKLASDIEEEAEQIGLLRKIGLTVMECKSYLQKHIAIIFFFPVILGGLLGIYLVNDLFSPYSAYVGFFMSRIAIMYGAIVLIDIGLYCSLRRRFFMDLKLY